MSETGIAARFSEGALQYDAHASVQYRMAETFVEWLLTDARTGPTRGNPLQVTELGCGTGFLTEQLRKRISDMQIDACDLSEEMLTQCHIRNQGLVRLHKADAATFSTGQRSDWTVSSFCLQWVTDLEASLRFHAEQTRRLSICVPCSGTFSDWRVAHQRAGLEAAVWPLPDALGLTQWMQNWATEFGGALRSRTLTVPEHHDSPLAFARHLRAIGADYSLARGAGGALNRVLSQLPSPYVARYEVLMLDLTTGP